MKKPNYADAVSKRIKENLKNFDVNGKDELEKIERYAKTYGFDFKKVHSLISNNEELKGFFIIHPERQNLHENVFRDFLRSLDGVYDVIQLPKSGKNAVHIVEQEVRKGEGTKVGFKTKSIDFSFRYSTSNKIFYVFHKYTKQSGGNQDNQKNDVKNAISIASNTGFDNDEIVVFFVCDGEYYEESMNPWSELQRAINMSNKNMYLCKSYQLEDLLKNV